MHSPYSHFSHPHGEVVLLNTSKYASALSPSVILANKKELRERLVVKEEEEASMLSMVAQSAAWYSTIFLMIIVVVAANP